MLEDDIHLLQTYETLMHQENSDAESLWCLSCWLSMSYQGTLAVLDSLDASCH